MVQFARRIIPHRWKINRSFDSKNYPTQKDFEENQFKAYTGTLFIDLDIRDADEEHNRYVNGVLHGGLSFYYGVAFAHVILQPCWTMKPWQDILIHELAHVAQFRWIGYKLKSHKKPLHSIIFIESMGYKAHGKEFRKAHKTFKERARKNNL